MASLPAQKAIVVGSGFAGLASALRLAKMGLAVTRSKWLVEKLVAQDLGLTLDQEEESLLVAS